MPSSSSARSSSCSIRIRCWVRAISSRWTELTSSSCSRARSRSDARTASRSCSRPSRACSTCGAGLGGQVDRDLEPGQHDAHGGADRLGGPALADQALAALGRPGAGLALRLGGAHQRVGAAVQGPSALLGGAQRQPGVHLGLPGLAGGVGQPLAVGGVGLLLGGVLGRGEPRLELGEAGQVVVAGLLGVGDGRGRAARPRRGRRGPASRTGRAPRPPPPGSRRTRAAWPGRRRPGAGRPSARRRAGTGRTRAARRRRPPRPAGTRPRRRLPGSRSGSAGWAEPPEAKWAPSRSPSRVTAVTSGSSRTRPRAAARSSTTATLYSSRLSAPRRSAGQSTTSTAYVAWPGRPGQSRSVGGSAAEQQAGAAEVVGLEVADGVDRGVGVAHGDRVGGRPEGAGDGGLVAAADREQGGDRAEQAGDRVGGGEQRAGAVLAVEAHLEGVLARGQRALVALGLLGLLAGLGEPLVDVVEGSHGGFVLGVEALLAGVEPGDLGLQRGEVALRRGRRGRGRPRGPG